MNRFFILLTFLVISIQLQSQTCKSYYSFHENYELVDFYNESTVANAHYWWNFGDGTGSNFFNPIHTFPENGNYLVTLFVLDTVSNCSDYYEQWIKVTSYNNTPCSPFLTDSTVTSGQTTYIYPIHIYDANCKGYQIHLDGIGGANHQGNSVLSIYPNSITGRYLMRSKYSNYNIDPDYRYRKAYKTIPHNNPSGSNYDDCSANFEFSVKYTDSLHQTIFCKPMNKTAIKYHWIISGFGDPIHYYTDTISQEYPLYDYLHMIFLTTEGASGCRDTLYQQIRINTTFKPSTVVGLTKIEEDISGFELFPNPFTDNTTLRFHNPNKEKFSLIITSVSGQIVRTIQNIRTDQITVDRKNLANGVYIFHLSKNLTPISTGKLIIQ